MVSLKYTITKEDYVNYYTYVEWDAPANRKKRNIYYGRQIVPIILFILAFYYTGLFQRNGNFILLIAGFLVLTMFLSVTGARTRIMKRAEQIADDPGNGSLFLESTLTASESGFSLKDEMTETKYQWKAFTKKLESKNYYFLFLNSIQALIVPKRIFTNNEQQSQFEKLLGQYLSFDADVSHLLKS